MSDHIFTRCTACNVRVERCLSPDNHRAQRKHVHCCDFLLGGVPPKGRRIRKQFKPGISKEEVKKFVYGMITDYERGTFIPTDKGKTPFKEIIERYDTEHIQEHSRHPNGSIKYYLKELKDRLGGLSIGTLTLDLLEKARSKFKEDTESGNANVNRCFAVLKTIMRRATEWGYIQTNPAQFLKALPIKEPIPRFLTVEEIARLRAQIKDQRLNDYVTVLLHTGIRPIDIKSLTWGQVDMQNHILHVTTHKGRQPHNYSVPIDAELWTLVQRRFKETKGAGLVFDTSNLRKLAEQAIKDSKINEGRKPEEQFTIYGLKHCYASHLLMNGASIFDVAKLLGHTDTLMVVKHYGFLTQEHLRAAQARVNLTPSLEPRFEIL